MPGASLLPGMRNMGFLRSFPLPLIWLNSSSFCTIKGLNPQTVKGYRTTLSTYLIPLDVFWGNSIARCS
jgi:hypothetical protein